MVYPSSEKSSIILLNTAPSPSVFIPITFSATITFGVFILTISTKCLYKMFLESSTCLGPAREKPWQGKPPSITSISTSGKMPFRSSFEISPHSIIVHSSGLFLVPSGL